MSNPLTRFVGKHKIISFVTFLSLAGIGGISSITPPTQTNIPNNQSIPVVLGASAKKEATIVNTTTIQPTFISTIIPKNTVSPTFSVTIKPTSKPTVTPTKKIIISTNTPVPQVARQCKYSCISPDRNCKDFTTHSEAQEFFECCGFTATNDPMGLDTSRGVGNGIACESLK